jgi:NDP-sugar pyrophosphorylase family protein
MSKRAVILAGGKGTRLKPYTVTLPKPLVPIGEMPIIEIIILQLRKYGFSHITITVNHLAEIIKAFCGNGSKWGIHIDYTLEEKALSTMGPLTLISDLPDNFLVLNGDILTDLDFNKLFTEHKLKCNNFTIAAYQRKEIIDYGVLSVDNNNKLIDFKEKPLFDSLVSMGVYIVNKSVVKLIPENTFFGFDHLMKLLISRNEYPDVYPYNGRWLDIGRPDDYEIAVNNFKPELYL